MTETFIPPGLLNTAVLFLVFNRPDTTEQVFEAIRKAQPPRLYIAADGPREGRDGEAERVANVREIATAVDWPCELKTLFRDENLGCKYAVSGAITWFFEQEDQGIILEDDCLPAPSFFLYAQELLGRYRNDKRIMVIGSQHFHGDAHKPPHSYFFSRYNHCWGWASWRRAWQYYDCNMPLWPSLRDTDWLLGIGDGSRLFSSYWTDIFNRVHAGTVDTWDYQWTFSCWAQNGLTVLPARNLVTNIGFGEDATHTTNRHSNDAVSLLENLDFPLVHPNYLVRDVKADWWSNRYHFRIGILKHIRYLIGNIPGVALLINALRKIFS